MDEETDDRRPYAFHVACGVCGALCQKGVGPFGLFGTCLECIEKRLAEVGKRLVETPDGMVEIVDKETEDG